jgi:hypothetical protein
VFTVLRPDLTMMDLSRRLIVPDRPEVEIYGDDDRADTFYVVPWAPSLAADDRARPAASLSLYVRRERAQTIPTGGQVSLTSALAVPDADRASLQAAIAALLAGPAPEGTTKADPVTVQLAAPEWISGTVTIDLMPSLTLTGQPSLFGDNHCAVTTPLDAAQSRALRADWDRGLPDARIAYRMVLRVSSAARTSERARDVTVDAAADRVASRSSHRTDDVRRSSAGTRTIAVDAPLWTPGLADVIAEIDLS